MSSKHPALKKKIVRLLKLGLSPDLMAGRLRKKRAPYLNQESIYQFLYSREGRQQNLRQYLRRAHRIRRKKNGRKHQKDIRIPNRVDIINRPMKCLGYRTPNEAYEIEMNKLQKRSLRQDIKKSYPPVALVN